MPLSSSSIAALRPQAPPKPIRMAVIGCGGIFERVYRPILSRMKQEVTVKALCDLDYGRASRLATAHFPHALLFTDVAELLEKVDVDAVIILTSERANMRTAKQVLETRNVAIYLEKPPASTSAELADLIEAESRSPRPIFTAFNRRHIPLFQNLPIPASDILHVSGRIVRTNRAVASFPFTAIHLLDSAQFFSKSAFVSMNADFEQNGVASWLLSGRLENGASYSLQFIPDGDLESEHLIFETTGRRWELHFPDSDGATPRSSFVAVNGKWRTEEVADLGLDSQEAMGFAPCFRFFVQQLTSETFAFPQHEIRASVPTIAALEAMQNSYVEALASARGQIEQPVVLEG